ncbi:hypothetical protein D3C73_1134230 [compost metagenome]
MLRSCNAGISISCSEMTITGADNGMAMASALVRPMTCPPNRPFRVASPFHVCFMRSPTSLYALLVILLLLNSSMMRGTVVVFDRYSSIA